MLLNIEDTDSDHVRVGPGGNESDPLYVKVYWTGGKGDGTDRADAMSMARTLMNEPRVDIEKLTGSEALKGLADAAYYSDVIAVLGAEGRRVHSIHHAVAQPRNSPSRSSCWWRRSPFAPRVGRR